MEIKGKVIDILDKKSGINKKGDAWSNQTFIVESMENGYISIYPFEVFNNSLVIPNIGNDVTVYFNIRTNKWEDKYFVSLSAWRVKLEGMQTESQTTTTTSILPNSKEDDLPF